MCVSKRNTKKNPCETGNVGVLDSKLEYTYFCITEHVHFFWSCHNQAILQPIEGVLPQVYETSFFIFSYIRIFHKFSVNYQCADWNGAVRYRPHFLMYRGFFFLFKDSELNELRKTIELLKKQNAAAQAAINGVINTPELNCKGEKRAPGVATVQCSWDFSPLGKSWRDPQRSALPRDRALGTCLVSAGDLKRVSV